MVSLCAKQQPGRIAVYSTFYDMVLYITQSEQSVRCSFMPLKGREVSGETIEMEPHWGYLFGQCLRLRETISNGTVSICSLGEAEEESDS